MIKVFLVDDQCLILEGIKAILQSESTIEIVGVAQDGQAALAQIMKLQPDIALVDIEMPKMDGITVTKYICQYLPNTHVIVLTSHQNRNYVAQALQAGASGYILKSGLASDLKQAIYSLSRGYSYIESRLLTQAINKIQRVDCGRSEHHSTYLKRYRKILYTPSTTSSQHPNSRLVNSKRQLSRGKNDQKRQLQVNKANVAAIFTLLTPNELSTSRTNTPRRQKSSSQQFEQNLLLLLTAIASLSLSIIVFSS